MQWLLGATSYFRTGAVIEPAPHRPRPSRIVRDLFAGIFSLSLSVSLPRARARECVRPGSEVRPSEQARALGSLARSLARSRARALGRTDLVGLVRSLARSLKPCLHAVKTLLCSVGSIGSVRASAQCVRLCVQASAPKHKSAHAQWCKPFSLGDKFAPSLLSRGLKSAIDDYASPPELPAPRFQVQVHKPAFTRDCKLALELDVTHLRFAFSTAPCVCGRFITNRSARASKDHHCIFGLQTSSHSPGPGVGR